MPRPTILPVGFHGVNYSLSKLLDKLLNKLPKIGPGPILTRQLSSAMFSASGHMMVLIGIALGVLQLPPERNIKPPPPKTVVTLQLPRPAAVKLPLPAAPTTPVTTTPATATPPPIPAPPPATTPVTAVAASAMAQPLKAESSLPDKTVPTPATDASNTAKPDPTPATNAVEPAPAPASNTAEANPAPASAQVAAIDADTAPDLPYYYSLKQLTERPSVIEDATTDMRLILPGIESQSVILRLLINEAGAIDQVEVEHSNLRPEVEPIVLGAFNRLRFTPGKIDGIAVKSQLKIEVMLENANTPALAR